MQPQPNRHLILALVVAMAPLALALPWWTIFWCAVFWGYLLLWDPGGSRMPSRAVRLVFISVGLIAVLLSAGLRLNGSDFIAMLAVMAGVKPLEVRRRRDSMVTVFLAYFLVITSLFVFENLFMTVYLFVSVWVTTAVLIRVNDPKGAFGPQMRLAARMVVLAIPLMMILFVGFPRLSGSIIGAPWSRQSRSGFSSVMRMGDVSQLVVMDTPAFSVSFDSPPPIAGQRYWRGIVFQHFDGETWRPARHQTVRQEVIEGKNIARYRVILEPHGHQNLFVLDLPVRATPLAAIMADHTLETRRPVQQRLTYDAVSYLDYRQGGADHPGEHCLALPPGRNPRATALGRQLARTHGDPAAVIRAGLDYFSHNDFVYTLKPDRLGRDALDDFLFVSRNGFCEHFAAAFSVMMRSAGVPARMVGGYQGGRWNAWGNFLTVRQADAHVWCEAWLKGRGWVRVDPTFEVAPDRIDEGIDGLFDSLPWSSGRHRDHFLSRWIEHARQTWEALNIRWNMWFMGFSAEDQAVLLNALVHGGRWLLLAMVPLGGGIVVLFSRRRGRKTQPFTIEGQALAAHDRFLKKMARIGLPKPPCQGPLDYSRMVMRHHPMLEKEVAEIVGRYLALRYGRSGGVDTLKALCRQVRRFNPKKAMENER